MPPGARYPLAAMVANVTAAFTLFVALFLSVFWTPGLLLAGFALAYASQPRAFSHVVGAVRRRELVARSARRYRGGWLDSPAARPG